MITSLLQQVRHRYDVGTVVAVCVDVWEFGKDEGYEGEVCEDDAWRD